MIFSGCISGENILKSGTEGPGIAQGSVSLSIEAVPEEVYSGETLSAYLSLKGPEDKRFSDIFACIYGNFYPLEDECKPVGVLFGGREISFKIMAPSLPEKVEKSEDIYARVFFKDSAEITAYFPSIDENERSIRLREGKPMPKFSLVHPTLPIKITIENTDFPIIVYDGEGNFEFTIHVKNVGNGAVFNPSSFPSEAKMPDLEEKDMGIAYLKLKYPQGVEITCDNDRYEKEGRYRGYYKIEFFENEDSLYCAGRIRDSSYSIQKIYPVIIEIDYAYYIDTSTSVKVKGRKGKIEIPKKPVGVPSEKGYLEVSPQQKILLFSATISQLKDIEKNCEFESISQISPTDKCIEEVSPDEFDISVSMGDLAKESGYTIQFTKSPEIVSKDGVIVVDSELDNSKQIVLKLLNPIFEQGKETSFDITFEFDVRKKITEEQNEIENEINKFVNCLNFESGKIEINSGKQDCSLPWAEIAKEGNCESKEICKCSAEKCEYLSSPTCKDCLERAIVQTYFPRKIFEKVSQNFGEKESEIESCIRDTNPLAACSFADDKLKCILPKVKDCIEIVSENVKSSFTVKVKEKDYSQEFIIRSLSSEQRDCVEKEVRYGTCKDKESLGVCIFENCLKGDKYFENNEDDKNTFIKKIEEAISSCGDDNCKIEKITEVLSSNQTTIMEGEKIDSMDLESTCNFTIEEIENLNNLCTPELKIFCKDGILDLVNKEDGYYKLDEYYINNREFTVVTPNSKKEIGYKIMGEEFSIFCEDKAVYAYIEPVDINCKPDDLGTCGKCTNYEYKFRISLDGLACDKEKPK